MNTTVRMKASEITKDWHVIDAAGRPLGRVATEAATLLRGKHKPTFEPHLDGGDFVIVINASQVRVSGNKAQQINYYTHSGYPGGIKTRSFAEQLARYPERVIEQAVWGMLPKGPLGKKMAKHLKVYPNANHPHQSQITGSQRAQDARKAALAETVGAPMKAPRLRPLSGAPVVEEAPIEESRRATIATELEAQAEAGVVMADETPPKEGYGTPTPAEAAVEAEAAIAAEPKKRTRKKVAAPAEATTEAAPEAAEEPAASEE